MNNLSTGILKKTIHVKKHGRKGTNLIIFTKKMPLRLVSIFRMTWKIFLQFCQYFAFNSIWIWILRSYTRRKNLTKNIKFRSNWQFQTTGSYFSVDSISKKEIFSTSVIHLYVKSFKMYFFQKIVIMILRSLSKIKIVRTTQICVIDTMCTLFKRRWCRL